MAREDDKINTNDQPKNNGSTQSDSTNPFIRFRHYADEQVSSVLQGVIGIPSIFSRPTGNQQWAVFDEELRRRDELQARQRKLKEAAERLQKNESSNNVDEVAG
ncbi:glycerol-3-phosphate dehydrogenase mitochondrial protein [Rutstroemia sp. NJR-2017a BBW]|nr:glycerol-3-phosphate dehydrogenase mitochondrial protein [Rutstroemia sp. NJR-2017a BBW]